MFRTLRGQSVSQRSWQADFIAGTVALGAFAFVFPKNTLDHQMTFFQFVIPLSLIAAWLVARSNAVIQVAAVAITFFAAYAGTHALRTMNNTPQRELELGIRHPSRDAARFAREGAALG